MKNGTFAGNLFWDAETKQMPTGGSVTEFKLAVDRRPKSGEKQEPLRVKASIWGVRGERLAPYLRKGTQVAICGDIDVVSYESKERGRMVEITCHVDNVTLLGSKPANADEATPANVRSPQEVRNEDIPF